MESSTRHPHTFGYEWIELKKNSEQIHYVIVDTPLIAKNKLSKIAINECRRNNELG